MGNSNILVGEGVLGCSAKEEAGCDMKTEIDVYQWLREVCSSATSETYYFGTIL